MHINRKDNAGFTLMEILVALGIFALLSGFALVVSLDAFRSHNFHTEQNLMVSVLQKARSQAVNNIDQAPHGVHITASNYSVFEGPTYTTGINFPVGSGFTPAGASDVVFSQLTGRVTAAPLTLTLTDTRTGKIFTITINNEGQINY